MDENNYKEAIDRAEDRFEVDNDDNEYSYEDDDNHGKIGAEDA